MTQKTTSESFFEQFCTQHGVRWEPVATEGAAGVKTPDYAIFPKDTKVVTEIKEIQENATERQQRKQLAEVGWSMFGERSVKVGDRGRDIITTAAKQLRRLAKGKSPALIVIYNPSFLLSHHTERRVSTTRRQVFAKFSEFFICCQFSTRNFAPGSLRNNDRQVDGPTACPFLSLLGAHFVVPKSIAAGS